MNRWLAIENSAYTFVRTDAPSDWLLGAALLRRVGQWGTGMAVDTYEYVGGPHYNQHDPNRSYRHWIVGHGYERNGLDSGWADPGTPYMPPEANDTFKASTADIASYLYDRGMVS